MITPLHTASQNQVQKYTLTAQSPSWASCTNVKLYGFIILWLHVQMTLTHWSPVINAFKMFV